MSNPQMPFGTPFADPRFAHLPPPPPAGAVWGAYAPPDAVARRDGRSVELGVRNLLLTLGVLSLFAGATSFIAVNWDSFDSTMRASLLTGVTVATVLGAVVASRRNLSGTSTALGWLAMVLLWVDAGAVERTLPGDANLGVFWAGAGAVLFVAFALLETVLTRWAMRVGAIGAWLLAWWAAFEQWGIQGADVWFLPVAAVVVWLQLFATAHRPPVSSWRRYGIGLAVAAVPAVLTTLADPGLARPLTVVGIAVAVLLVGFALRELAAIWVAGVSLGTIAVAQIFEALHGMPGWVVFTVVGVVLLVLGAAFERRLRREAADGDVDGAAVAPTPPPVPAGRPGPF